MAAPPPPKDKNGKEQPWKPETVTDAVLEKSKRIALESVAADGAATISNLFGFRLAPQESSRLFVRVPKETPAPGGFVTREDFTAIVNVPAFNKTATILGRGGILALNGERKLSIQSRGLAHLRYTLARVPGAQINHLVTQTNGRFESPGFFGDLTFENLAHFHSSVQAIAKKNNHEANYSAFDFAPALTRAEPGGEDAQRGLFYLEVAGVRRRTAEDAKPNDGDPDPEWIGLRSEQRHRRHHADEEDESAEEGGGVSGDSRFVLITDLGLIVKRNADGTREVFVQSFKDRAPVAGVHITALAKNGDTLAEADTTAQGRASLPALDALLRERRRSRSSRAKAQTSRSSPGRAKIALSSFRASTSPESAPARLPHLTARSSPSAESTAPAIRSSSPPSCASATGRARSPACRSRSCSRMQRRRKPDASPRSCLPTAFSK